MKPIDYSQFDFHDDIRKIIADIRASGERFDLVVGLSRGGLVPGVVLSHNLGVPFKAVNWSKNHQQTDPYLWAEIARGDRRILIVDDMVDSGELLGQLLQSFNEWCGGTNLAVLKLAVLINNTDVKSVYQNETGELKVNFWGREISRLVTPNWITYWWEQQLK